jgi:hypothetical protein
LDVSPGSPLVPPEQPESDPASITALKARHNLRFINTLLLYTFSFTVSIV